MYFVSSSVSIVVPSTRCGYIAGNFYWLFKSDLFSAMVPCSFPDNNVRARFLHIHVGSLKNDCQDTAAKSYSGSAVWK